MGRVTSIFGAMAMILIAPGAAQIAWAAPKAEPWARWQAHDPASAASIDHADWDRLLKTYVMPGTDGVARVAYAKVTAADRAKLADYVLRLMAAPVGRHARAEQLAYWINLYNALTVKLVLDHHPVKSIRDIRISPGLFAIGPWGRKLATVEGEALSLDDIEHRILRPIWRDPRIHYAVNCAAIGCPDLLAAAFTARNAELLLEQGARRYVNHPRGARVDNGRLVASSIYVWFQEDFGGDDAGVILHLRRYAAPPLAAALDGVGKIADHGYDWSLNERAE